MSEVPRRLPPTQGQRIVNVDRSHASLSAGGRTAQARPVQQPGTRATIYSPGGASNVLTGDASGSNAVAIESTTSGAGEVYAAGGNAVAIGHFAQAQDAAAVAIGLNSYVPSGTADATALGVGTLAAGNASAAVGSVAHAYGDSSIALGANAQANGAQSVALGLNSIAGDNEIALGTSSHFVIVRGGLCLADSAGNLHKLVVSTGGALSTVAYP